MESKLSLDMKKKKKSTSASNEKIQQKYQCLCSWFYLSHLKNKSKRKLGEVIGDDKTVPVVPVSKITRKTIITRIPKMCTSAFLMTVFTNLSDSGAQRMDEREIMNAVNIVSSAKKDLDQGKPWNGNVEIVKNLKLKLYKSGLVLCQKK